MGCRGLYACLLTAFPNYCTDMRGDRYCTQSPGNQRECARCACTIGCADQLNVRRSTECHRLTTRQDACRHLGAHTQHKHLSSTRSRKYVCLLDVDLCPICICICGIVYHHLEANYNIIIVKADCLFRSTIRVYGNLIV